MVKDGETTYEQIARRLFEPYASIYVVSADGRYKMYHESKEYASLKLEHEGKDFFGDLPKNIAAHICPDDRLFVRYKLEKSAVEAKLREEGTFSITYRIMRNGNEKDLVYYQLKATSVEIKGSQYILIGIRDIDRTLKREIKRRRKFESMKDRDKAHLTAILDSAVGYLEADLTEDAVLEKSLSDRAAASTYILPPSSGKKLKYSVFRKWMLARIVRENKEGFADISRLNNLKESYKRGEKRASVPFSILMSSGEEQPCRAVFFLYEDKNTDHLHLFCVIYDLTEKQKREKDIQALKKALELSRVHLATSQMAPHFLYNSLACIQEIITEDPEQAAALVGDLTVHLRNCVRALTSDEPFDFEKELENIKAYVNIEKVRFGEDKLRVKFETPVVDFQILPLSIQPIVENAIRHGIYQRGKKGGTVLIRTAEKNDFWVVKVSDNGVGFDPKRFDGDSDSVLSDSTGLTNLCFRLKTVMNADVTVRSKPATGTTVTVRIPKHPQGRGDKEGEANASDISGR